MTESGSSGILLTLDDVRALVTERDRVDRELSQLNAHYQAIEAKIDAVSLFLTPDQRSSLLLRSAVSSAGSDDQGGDNEVRGKWRPVIIDILERSNHGLTTSDFKEKLADHPLGAETGVHGHVLYSALAKMVSKGLIVKDGDYYCLKGQGKPEGAISLGDTGALIQENIVLALKHYAEPVEAKRVMAFLLESPARAAVQRSPTYPYNMLSKMAVGGKIIRDGKLYSLIPDENEPRDAGASHGSDAGSKENVFS